MRRQLTRAGIPASQADAAAEAVLETLQATLSDPRGQWLLSQSGARREWPLIDAAGKVSVIDLALSTEDGWLIVDYKTGRSQPGESAEALPRACANATASSCAATVPRSPPWTAARPAPRCTSRRARG